VATQRQAGAMQPLLHVGFRHAGDRRGFAGREPFDLAHHDDHAQRRRQLLQPRVQPPADRRIDQLLIRGRRGISRIDGRRTCLVGSTVFQALEMGRLAGAAAPFHEAGVSHRRVEPRPKRFRLIDSIHVLIRLDQRVLHHVLGILRVTADEQTEPIRRLLRSQEQALDRRTVAGCCVTHQLRVVRIAAIDCHGHYADCSLRATAR
jgi:hypothetical protein